MSRSSEDGNEFKKACQDVSLDEDILDDMFEKGLSDDLAKLSEENRVM